MTTTPAMPGNACPKCGATSGNDWSQCNGSCPMYGSPHFKPKANAHQVELPELPEGTQGTFYEPGYTADQMRAYALATLQAKPAARNIAAELSLMVLCAVKDLPGLHANMLKDIESAIEANRAAAQAAEVSEPALLGTIARGWCHPKNSGKEVDADLAEAIVEEVRAILALRPQSEPVGEDLGKAFYELACQPWSIPPDWSALNQRERDDLRNAASRFAAMLRPQAVITKAQVPMTEGQVKQAVRFFRASTPRDVDEWVESIIRYTEEFHGITAPAGGEG